MSKFLNYIYFLTLNSKYEIYLENINFTTFKNNIWDDLFNQEHLLNLKKKY